MRVASCLCRAHREESRAAEYSSGFSDSGTVGEGLAEREGRARLRSEWGERDARRCAPAVNG